MLPPPVATVGGRRSGDAMTADAFRAQAGVGMHIGNFPFEIHYEIVGFTFTVGDGKDDVKSIDCQGASFSPLAKQYIDEYVKAGELVTIDKIRVKRPDGREFKMPSLVYTIK